MIKKIILAIIFCIFLTIPAQAGWCKNTIGWYYEYAPKSVYTNGWYWIDGNNDGISECYYFDNNGYLLTNTTTPDGYKVDANGAWVADGKVVAVHTGIQKQEIYPKQNVIVAPPQYYCGPPPRPNGGYVPIPHKYRDLWWENNGKYISPPHYSYR